MPNDYGDYNDYNDYGHVHVSDGAGSVSIMS